MSIDGYVLPVDKPEGPTSHDVVALARKSLGIRKIGHTGTLDPFATGLLVLCVGKATRLAEYLTGLDKSYVAEARLGVETDTLDRDGEVVSEHAGWSELSKERIEAALRSFVGEIDQVPPQYSAKKVGGEAMHRRARRGETVVLRPARVTIHETGLERSELPSVTFRVRCSTGTYVRALARDLGRRLGVGAHLTALRRTRIGRFDVDDAVRVDQLADACAVAGARVGCVRAMDHLPSVAVDEEAARRLRHGQRIPLGDRVATTPSDPVDAAGLVTAVRGDELIALARLEGGMLKPAKVFPA